MTTAAMAQSDMIRLSYEYKWVFKGQERVSDYNLHTSAEKSIFYNPTTVWMDSISKSDAACQAYGEMASVMMQNGQGANVPNRSVSMYVLKSFTDGSLRMYEDFNDEYAFYDEAFDEMVWEIGDSVKSVLGYDCTLATTDYHGRHWEAWFATDIPLQDGPWKFHGLPGLILSVHDSSGKHGFEATGIEKACSPMPIMHRPDYYSREKRINFLKAKRSYEDNPLASMLENLPAGCKVLDADGNEISSEALIDEDYDFLETDYR